MVFTYLVSVKGVQTNFRFSRLNFAKVLFFNLKKNRMYNLEKKILQMI